MKHFLIASLMLPLSFQVCADDAGIPEVADAVSPVPGIVSSGRISSGDISELERTGIRHVIDLRLDTETPDFDEAAAVRKAGMSYSHLPIRGATDLTEENVRSFDALLRASDRPVLVHCASGNRVGAMAALRAAWIEKRSVEEAIAIGKAWGLKGLESDVRNRIEAGMQGVQPGM